MTKLNKKSSQPALSLVNSGEDTSSVFPTKKLEKKVTNLVARKGAAKFDPIVGADSGLVSVASSFQRLHGMHLPNILGALLQYHGLVVLHNQKIPVFQAASSLVKENAPDALRNIRIKATNDVACHYEADLTVFCPKTGWLGVFDGKRGLGNADSSSKSVLEEKLRAVHLSVCSYMRMQGYGVVSTDVRMIDFYGQTGYPTDLKVNGCELDRYFGVPVQDVLAAFNKAMAIERAKTIGLMAPPLAIRFWRLSKYRFANSSFQRRMSARSAICLMMQAPMTWAYLPCAISCQRYMGRMLLRTLS